MSDITDNTEPLDLGVPEFQDLVDPKHSRIFRVFWSLIIAVCSLICLFQLYHSAKRYLSYPIVVDIYIQDRTSLYFPPFSLSSGENEYITEYIGQGERSMADIVMCAAPIKAILKQNDVEYDKLRHNDGESYTYGGHEFFNHMPSGNISITTFVNMFGQETRIGNGMIVSGNDLNTELKIKIKQGKLCTPSIVIASFTDKVEFKIGLPIFTEFAIHITLGTRNYKFLNTPQQICCSDEEFEKCYRRCLIKRIQEETKCKLPFFPPSIDLPNCNNGTSADNSYTKATNIYAIPDVFRSCDCIRTCNEGSFTILPNIVPWNNGEAVIIFKADHYEVGFTERLAYDLSNLLSDIGGNLGLFLGLSIPAIVNIVFVIIKLLKRKYFSRKVYCRNGRFQRRVLKYRLLYLRKLITVSDNKNQSQCNSVQKMLRIVVTFACITLAMFMIQERVKYYFTYPIRKVVVVQELDEVIFPSYTICGVDAKFGLMKRKFADAENISWCDVDMFDLLGGAQPKSINKIWKKSEASFANNFQSFVKSFSNIRILSPNYTSIPTHLGQCSHFTSNVEQYNGLFTAFAVPYVSSPLHECRNNYFVVYYDDLFSDTYNVLTRIEAPISAHSFFDYRLTTVKRLNYARHTCLEKQHQTECKTKCVLEQLQNETMLCELPFLAFLPNLSKCITPEMAKETREKFAKIKTGIELGSTCKCDKLCEENVINLTAYSAVQSPNPFALLFLMLSNIAENIIEVETYSLVAMFSDIGNSLGLAVGFSVLTGVQSLRQLFWST